MIKYRIFCLLLFVLPVLVMISCLDSTTTETDDWSLSNAQIATFSLSSDSLPALDSVVFTIDQINGKIYNKDSMRYGTELKHKVICSLTYEIGAYSIMIMPEATGDTIYDLADSVDFSQPVMITIYPYDGISAKTYEARLNIHQINPDSMVWSEYSPLIGGASLDEMKVVEKDGSYLMFTKTKTGIKLYKADKQNYTSWAEAGKNNTPDNAIFSQITTFNNTLYLFTDEGALYSSTDGQTWTQQSDAPKIKALLGSIQASSVNGDEKLAVIAELDGVNRFVIYDKEWIEGDEVTASFPIEGFCPVNYESMYYQRLTVVSGKDKDGNLSNAAWSTIDGLSWTKLTNESLTFTPREGAIVSRYDSCLFLTGGINEAGVALTDIYRSKDKGVTWEQTGYIFPEDYAGRGYSSVIITDDKYMLLFGGKTARNVKILNEVFSGRINYLGFIE
ncbi:MAG: DUF6242 domain-containing protein [Tannerella sp.]|nr:DUF6242 domain-containing protein [Tannerella sp.]